jgi:hypothetical protein
METETRIGAAVGAHLVGGLKAPDAETAMRTTARILGRHLHALSDGETGERSQWIICQLGRLTAIDGIEMAGAHGVATADNPDYAVFRPSPSTRRSPGCRLARWAMPTPPRRPTRSSANCASRASCPTA